MEGNEKMPTQRIKIGFGLLPRQVINMAKAVILSPLRNAVSKYFYLLSATICRLNLAAESFENLNIDSDKKTVAIIMPIYNQFKYTKRAVASYYDSLDEAYNYILMIYDNNSTDESRDYFLSNNTSLDNLCYVRYKRNVGVTWPWNEGVRFSLGKLKASHVFLVNNDLVFTKNSIGKMIDTLNKGNDPAIVGPLSNCPGHDFKQDIRAFYPEYRASDQIRDIELIAVIINDNKVVSTDHINGFCWGGNSRAFKENLFAYFFIPYYFDLRKVVYENENEFQKRFIEKGFKILLATNIFVFHYGNITAFQHKLLDYSGNKVIMSQESE